MSRVEWRPFPEAREFARSLKLLDMNEWYAYARGDLSRLKGRRPEDIPFNPYLEYRGAGWAGMRDWLGPPPVRPARPGFLEFKRARRFARTLKLRSSAEWRRWCAGRVPNRPERPGNVPELPAEVYPDAWRGWDDWLGTKRGIPLNPNTAPFEEAREFVRGLGLVNVTEWRAYCRGERTDLGTKPSNIPACPDSVYVFRGWVGFGDWLGTGNRPSRLSSNMPFPEARRLAMRLGLSTGDDWRDWSQGKRPDLPPWPENLTTNPHRTYAGEGWKGWGDFLGTGRLPPKDRTFRTYRECRDFARSLNLRHVKDWRAFCRGERPDLGERPGDIPWSPDIHYAGSGWTEWGEFLGTSSRHGSKRNWRTFASARKFARSLGLKGVEEWRDYGKGLRPDLPPLPDDIPAAPEGPFAKNGWKGWRDFLGNGGGIREHIPFRSARALARSLGLRGVDDWKDWLRGDRPDLPPPPEAMPRSPSYVYRERGWRGWGDFLGTGNIAPANRVFRTYEEAREFAKTLGLRSRAEWWAWSRGNRPDLPPRPPDIPGSPHKRYKNEGWLGWPDFLGFERR